MVLELGYRYIAVEEVIKFSYSTSNVSLKKLRTVTSSCGLHEFQHVSFLSLNPLIFLFIESSIHILIHVWNEFSNVSILMATGILIASMTPEINTYLTT